MGYHLHSDGPKQNLTQLQLCKRNSTDSKDILGHLFCKREYGQNGLSVIVAISEYSGTKSKPDSGWSELADTELTLDVSFLRIVLNVSDEIIHDYLKWRNIRNTQIAHWCGKENAIELDDILRFYNQIIVPVIEKYP